MDLVGRTRTNLSRFIRAPQNNCSDPAIRNSGLRDRFKQWSPCFQDRLDCLRPSNQRASDQTVAFGEWVQPEQLVRPHDFHASSSKRVQQKSRNSSWPSDTRERSQHTSGSLTAVVATWVRHFRIGQSRRPLIIASYPQDEIAFAQ